MDQQLNQPNPLLVVSAQVLLHLQQALVLEALELLPILEEVSLAALKPNLGSALAAPRQLLPLVDLEVLVQQPTRPVEAYLVVGPSLEVSLEEHQLDLEVELVLGLAQALEQALQQVSFYYVLLYNPLHV